MAFYGMFAILAMLLSVLLLVPVAGDYVSTGLVDRFPTLFVASIMVVVACLSGLAGLILDGIRKSRYELSRLTYLRLPAVRLSEPMAASVDSSHVQLIRQRQSSDQADSVFKVVLEPAEID